MLHVVLLWCLRTCHNFMKKVAGALWVVHRGPAVDPPSRRQQVLYAVFLLCEDLPRLHVGSGMCSFGLCMDDLLMTLRAGGSMCSM